MCACSPKQALRASGRVYVCGGDASPHTVAGAGRRAHSQTVFCIQLKVQVAKGPNLCGGMDLKIRLFTLPTAIGVSFGWKQWKRMDRYGTY